MHNLSESLEPHLLKPVFGCAPSSVVCVSSMIDGRPIGLIASTFVAISIAPPLVGLCVQRSSMTWPLLAKAERLGISVLAHTQAIAAREIARRDSAQRFDGVAYTATQHGAVFLDGSTAWLDCGLADVIEVGDHQLAVLRIFATSATNTDPLIFHQSGFRDLGRT